MPQMSPLKWLLLFISFSITYLIVASPIRLDTNQTKTNTLYLTWKW